MLGFSNHHSNFLHGIIESSPVVPVDAIREVFISIFPIQVSSVACVVPPSP